MNPLLRIRKSVFEATQAEMASIAQVSQTTVCKWERGEHSPGSSALARIRSEANKRGIPWEDRWFFEVPEAAAPAESAP